MRTFTTSSQFLLSVPRINGEFNGEYGSLTMITMSFNAAPVFLCYLFGNCQTQPSSLTSLGAEKDIEYPLARLLQYANAIILHRDRDFAFALSPDSDYYLTPIFIQSVNCIREQIEQTAMNALWVSLYFGELRI
jgi:hypothetical protein